MPFITALYTAAGLENLAALSNGSTLPNMITKSCWSLYASLGGAGGPLGFVCLCFSLLSLRAIKH